MLKVLAIGSLSVFGLLCMITAYACCNVAGRADEWEEQYMRQNEDEIKPKEL